MGFVACLPTGCTLPGGTNLTKQIIFPIIVWDLILNVLSKDVMFTHPLLPMNE